MSRIVLILAVILAVASAACGGDELRVHLPREVSVRGDSLTLGRLAICRSDDESIARRAEQVTMGRAPFSGESLVIKRSTVLSRLASSGFDADGIAVTGADSVTVSRSEHVVASEELLSRADELLEQKRPGPEGCVYRLVGTPDDMPVPAGDEDISLEAALADSDQSNRVRVVVSAVSGGQTVGRTELAYRVMYPHREAVAAEDLPAGTVLTEQNTTVRTSTSHRPQNANWQPPIGQITIRSVSAGTVLRDSFLRGAQPAFVVERNQTVVMKIDGEGFTLRWLARTLEEGAPGDIIRVRNVDSNRVVSARVAYDGTVQPVYEGIER
ncbi:MAG: flagellar basal body P-ring formation chaperone FlgA [Phycisphaerae bacterium]